MRVLEQCRDSERCFSTPDSLRDAPTTEPYLQRRQKPPLKMDIDDEEIEYEPERLNMEVMYPN